MLLADLGAEVVKVEGPAGSGDLAEVGHGVPELLDVESGHMSASVSAVSAAPFHPVKGRHGR
jgi:crotonobetainyl-CoA:carnitine CoA-transferase CaiB-like acyl-CoA transferase